MKKSLLSVLVASLFFIQMAEAGRAQRREVRQQGRIAEGVKSGELTKHEAKKLERGEARIDRAEDKAMADGSMSAEEKAKIEKMQDHQSKKIYRQKHDNQQRGDGNPATTEPVSQPAQ